MRPTSRGMTHWRWSAATLVLALVALGCGQEDLYRLPESPYDLVARLPLPSINDGVTTLGDYAYVAAGQAGMHVVDISDPSHPLLVKTINTPKYCYDVEVMRIFPEHNLWDIALLIEGTEGILAYDIRDPNGPALIPAGGSTAIDVNGLFVQIPQDPDAPNIVYQAEGWKGVRALISDPTSPGSYPHESWAYTYGSAMEVYVKGGYAFVADDQMGLTVMDLRVLPIPPTEVNDRVVGWADTPGNALAIDVVDDNAFIADKRYGLAVFDISDPRDPEMISRLDLDGWAVDIKVRDQLAFIAADDAGLMIVDVSDPANPKLIGNHRTSNATGVGVTLDGLVLVSDEDDGLYIFRSPTAFPDETPPAQVNSLTTRTISFSRLELSWYATGDDDYLGRAQSYDGRFSTEPLDDDNWSSSEVLGNLPAPEAPGQLQVYELADQAPGAEYYFALRVEDEVGNVSAISPSVIGSTLAPGTYLFDGSLSPDLGEVETVFEYRVHYYDSESDAPVAANVVIDGEARPMALESGDYYEGATFFYGATLLPGFHSYYFSFDDGAGHVAETEPVEGPLVGGLYFTMGSPLEEPGRGLDEARHVVAFTDSLTASDHEVTQGEWNALMFDDFGNPSHFQGDELPVESVTFYQALEYCNRLSSEEGLTPPYTLTPAGEGYLVDWNRDADGWRLPTEAEWEFLCRAGTESAFHNGSISQIACSPLDGTLDAAGWYCGNSDNETHVGGGKAPNNFNLYDMHGNVMEMCWDWYGPYPEQGVLDPIGPDSGVSRVMRGGSWFHQAKECRAAYRSSTPEDSAHDFLGFRVVRTIPMEEVTH